MGNRNASLFPPSQHWMIPVFASRVGNTIVGNQERYNGLIKSMVIEGGFNWSNALSCVGTHLEYGDKAIANSCIVIIHDQHTARNHRAIVRDEMVKETVLNQKLLCFVVHPNAHIASRGWRV